MNPHGSVCITTFILHTVWQCSTLHTRYTDSINLHKNGKNMHLTKTLGCGYMHRIFSAVEFRGWPIRLQPPPPLRRRTDAVTHSTPVLVWQRYCIMATSLPVYLFKHVKHGTQNIQNDIHKRLSDSFRVHQIRFPMALRSDPAGELTALPRPSDWYKGAGPLYANSWIRPWFRCSVGKTLGNRIPWEFSLVFCGYEWVGELKSNPTPRRACNLLLSVLPSCECYKAGRTVCLWLKSTKSLVP